jgi:hypothetical protein
MCNLVEQRRSSCRGEKSLSLQFTEVSRFNNKEGENDLFEE